MEEKAGNLPRQPRTAPRRASNHDAVGAGSRQRRARARTGADITVHDDGNGHAMFDLAHGFPVGAALIELAAGSAVHGDERNASTLGAARKLGGFSGAITQARRILSVTGTDAAFT